MKVTIQNQVPGLGNADIYVLLTGIDFKGSGIEPNIPTRLSELTALSFDVSKLLGGRLYISYYAPLPPDPEPSSGQYYGYLELTVGDDSVLWVNLSSVDTFGVPLQFKVGNNQVGYQQSHNQIVESIRAIPEIKFAQVAVDCDHGHTKVIGANVSYAAQPPFTLYLKDLAGSQLRVQNLQDSPLQYDFNGQFKASGGITLKSASNSDTFEITTEQLTSDVVYLCNGNCVWNGVQRNAMAPNDTCAAIYRDIMIGLNEGYFSRDGENNTRNFPEMEPFQNQRGNQYARAIHLGCQSYGYPFADMHLKTLIHQPVDGNTGFDLVILGDDAVSHF